MQHDTTGGGAAPEVYSPATKRIVLIVTTMSSFITPFLVSSVNIALPTMAHEFSLNAVMMSWVVTAYLLSAAIFLVPFGRLADIYGRKKIYLAGNALIAVSSFLAARSTSYVMLVSARTLEGLAAAMIFGTGIAILISVYPFQERGRVIGINVAGTYFGLSLGPLIGGWLTQYLGWRSIFAIIVPIGIPPGRGLLEGQRGVGRSQGRAFRSLWLAVVLRGHLCGDARSLSAAGAGRIYRYSGRHCHPGDCSSFGRCGPIIRC